MTTINLHGILAKEFGEVFLLKIRKPKDAIMAINMNRSNFIKRVMDLSKEGLHYAIIVDGKDVKEHLELEIKKAPRVIDIVPMICGSGVVVAVVGAIALYASTTAAVIGTIGAFGAGLLGALGAMALSIGIQMMLAPNAEKAGKAPSIEVGGVKESFIFSSKANVADQGSPVPVGYGRLRIGSNVISASIKSHPNKDSVLNDLTRRDSDRPTNSSILVR